MLALVLTAGAAAMSPRFSWETVPVFYHSCNFTGPFTDAALDTMAKFSMVTVEKGQGVWDVGDTRFAEDKIIDALRGVKARDATVSTVMYLNSILDWPFYRLHDELMQRPSLWVRNQQGAVCRTDGDNSFPNHTGMLSFDFAQPAARALFVSACLNATRTGHVDGCFSDRASGKPNCQLANETAFAQGHLAMHQELQRALGSGPLIANNGILLGVGATMLEGFAANEASILSLQEAASAGVLVQAHAGYGEDGTADEHCSQGVTNSLAAFLIGAGENCFYACSRGWNVQADPVEAAWRPEYDKPLGAPTGPAQKTAGVYRRAFRSAHGETVVTFDTARNRGSIRWAAPLVKEAPATLRRGVAVPNSRQLEFMELELTQFMHFGLPTFWDPPEAYLRSDNPTYHDCYTTSIDHGPQTAGWYPCLKPDLFHPSDLDADDWMAASASLGTREIILTAHHEGGFALWPSQYTNYSVAASAWRGGKGDVLREFADAANRWGIKISYYLNVQDDGYMSLVANYSCAEFTRRQVGMLREVLTHYGPVNRFWFDGTRSSPCAPGAPLEALWAEVYRTIRAVSPATMVSAYRGDVCAAQDGATLYTNDGPPPNSSDTSGCQPPRRDGRGRFFHPTEEHGITIQEGPDGNTDEAPTYWFWHPWACARNVSGCPWTGHANASRLFDSYLLTVGRGAVLNMNIPPERTGRMNASVARVMAEAGAALNATFGRALVALPAPVSGACAPGLARLRVPAGATFDYVLAAEEMAHGARVANYSVEYRAAGSDAWRVLVPPVAARNASELGDRPDGHDPRDGHVGRKRIDLPIVPARGVAEVRFNCLEAFETPVHLKSFSLHTKTVPWERDRREVNTLH